MTLIPAIALAVAAAIWIRQAHPLARPVGYRPRHRGTTHQGATAGWSPAQEEADASADQLTPTGLLEVEPPATLDDGTVIGSRGLPSWAALSTDTHHAMDLRWEIMLAEFRHNMDAIIAALGEPVAVAS